MKSIVTLLLVLIGSAAWADAPGSRDLLIKFRNSEVVNRFALQVQGAGSNVENLGNNWLHVKMNEKQAKQFTVQTLRANPEVLSVQPNYPIRLYNNFKVTDAAARQRLLKYVAQEGGLPGFGEPPPPDNPAIPAPSQGGATGADPLYDKQWGMKDNGVERSWNSTRGNQVIVAVIDTGVDYTHEDLVQNIWRNAGEMGTDAQGKDKSSNSMDDDGNGYVDDVIGWDFVTNDNKPYDFTTSIMDMLMGGGNPGHGTHCAGNVAARGGNGKGIAGVAPDARIMALRFLSEKGQGDTAGAVKAINYAVKMGAKIMSNSWGSEGEDDDQASNQALKDAITNAQNAGVLFIAAAGNGHSGVGYDNDSDAKPAFPASYDHDIIVSVAATNNQDGLGAFSNWGAKSVDLGAPGVAVFSTMVNNK